MNWHTNDTLPLVPARQIIVSAWNEKLKVTTITLSPIISRWTFGTAALASW